MAGNSIATATLILPGYHDFYNMKTVRLATLGCLLAGMAPLVCGLGMSEATRRALTAEVPEWVTLGSPIKVYPDDGRVEHEGAFRPLSGGSRSTRDRVTIAERGIDSRWLSGSVGIEAAL